MTHPVPQLLKIPQYRRLALGSVVLSFAEGMEQIIVAWYVYDVTRSALLTALAWSARALPRLFLGALAGVFADRYPRNRVMFWNALGRAASLGVVVVAILVFHEPVFIVLVMTAVGGYCRTQHLTASQTLAIEMVPRLELATASSFLVFAQRLTGPVALAGTGILLSILDITVVLTIATVTVLLAAVLFNRLEPVRVVSAQANVLADIKEGARVFSSTPVIAQLLVLMMVVEIFAFAYGSLLPVLAVQAYQVGSDGLGLLQGSASVGAILGLGVLSAFANRVATGRVLLGVSAGFGILLIVLSSNESFFLGLVILVGIGIAASLVDAIEWALLQANVAERLRGRVLGAWSIVIGLGFVGPIILGAVADAFGYQTALAGAGLLVLVFSIGNATSATLRNATTTT